MMKCSTKECSDDGVFKLAGPVDLCVPCFEKLQCDENTPSIGPMGPSILMLTWDPLQGDSVPDALLKGCVGSKIKEFIEFKGDYDHIIGSTALLNEYRLAILKGLIAPYHIMLRSCSYLYGFDSMGNLTHYDKPIDTPHGVPCEYSKTVREILKTQIKLRKEGL